MRIVFVASGDQPEGSLRLILQEAGHQVVRCVAPAGPIMEILGENVGPGTDLVLVDARVPFENRSDLSTALRLNGYHRPVLVVRERGVDPNSLPTFTTTTPCDPPSDRPIDPC